MARQTALGRLLLTATATATAGQQQLLLEQELQLLTAAVEALRSIRQPWPWAVTTKQSAVAAGRNGFGSQQ